MATKPTSTSKPLLLPLLVVSLLCTASYLFGLNLGNRASPLPTTTTTTVLPCLPSSSNSTLDFDAHHRQDDTEDPLSTSISTVQFPSCDATFSEYTPCEDVRRSLRYPRERLIYRERHCSSKSELLKCLVPAPFGYKNPFPWPQSRGVAWFANVPHKELSVEKAVQNWIRVDGDKFRFPGGGTMFPRGADKYIDEIDELVSLHDGSVRTAIDTGCGVASWGAYLMSRNVLAVSFAPRDSHEAQVQFALERGVPALIGVLASIRLPYPSRSFDMAHCSRCLIPWHLSGGQYLAEVDRILRPGGYWVLSGPPINWQGHWKGWNRTRDDLKDEQVKIEAVATSLCWNKLKQKGDIAIWQKPVNHLGCRASRKQIQSPPFCSGSVNPDDGWYAKMETCITPMPKVDDVEEVAGGALEKWPARLMAVPPRVASGMVDGVTVESFHEDSKLWVKRAGYYKRVIGELAKPGRYRNLLDMNAKLGGFAAALVNDPVWVMNVVPTIGVNTLGVIYERGLIGTYQDWCEAMSTYPRTYDFIHADGLFTLYQDRCEMEDILLEMDRILRPEGAVILRDDVDVLVKVKSITDRMRWDSKFADHEDGPLVREKILVAVKQYWTLPKPEQS